MGQSDGFLKFDRDLPKAERRAQKRALQRVLQAIL
jgi:hypothetical protein